MQGGKNKKISQFKLTRDDDSKENASIWPKSSFSKEARLTQMQAFAIQADSESIASSTHKRNELKNTKVAVERIRDLRSNSGHTDVPQFVQTCESARNPSGFNQTKSAFN